ncbi:MAG: GspE/PulE family protein [Puniceicoccaceae bacterium]
MKAYRPYLLPLLDPLSASTLKDEPVSALEEEAAINKLPYQNRPSWNDIAEKVRSEYGLDLLLEVETPSNRKIRKYLDDQGSAYLTVSGEVGDRSYFFMSHPDHLPSYDNSTESGRQAVLVKPSQFSLLSNGALMDLPRQENSSNQLTDTSLVAFTEYLLDLIGDNYTSDWHLEPKPDGYSSRLRIHGQLSAEKTISRQTGRWIIQSAISQCGLSASAAGKLLEGSFTVISRNDQAIQARMSLVPSRAGQALVMRFLYVGASPRTLADIGMSRDDILNLSGIYNRGEGLWLVVGPTGSGKSTTLHALLSWCVRDNEKVLTIEDPVEQIVKGVQQVQVDRERGLDFARAVRAFLRQSPDTILIGEIRDVETASIALQSARTGHRVLSTLHAGNTAGIIRRFKDLEQDKEDVKSVCDVLIHQRLIPLVCPECRFEHKVEPGIHRLADALGLESVDNTAMGIGCKNCKSGYSGRMAVFCIGSFEEEMDSDRKLLEAVWMQLGKGKTDLKALQSYLPAGLRQHFTLCQV